MEAPARGVEKAAVKAIVRARIFVRIERGFGGFPAAPPAPVG